MEFEINRNDAELLDKIIKLKLESNGSSDMYIQKQIGVEEGYYKHLINLICEYNILTDIVEVEESQFINRVDPIDYVTQNFIEKGGFVGVYEKMLDASKVENEADHIRKENERLLNEEFKHKQQIRELEDKNRKLTHKNQIFSLIRHWQWILSLVGWFTIIILKYFKII